MRASREFWEGEEGNLQDICMNPSFTSDGQTLTSQVLPGTSFVAYADVAGPETRQVAGRGL